MAYVDPPYMCDEKNGVDDNVSWNTVTEVMMGDEKECSAMYLCPNHSVHTSIIKNYHRTVHELSFKRLCTLCLT